MPDTAAVTDAFSDAARLLGEFSRDPASMACVADFAARLAATFRAGGKVLICGNGGSHCDALHFAEEWTGRFRKNRRALPALALGEATHLTCTGNDFGFDEVFARQVDAFGTKGDLLVVLSTSGNSPNILRAAQTAREKGMNLVALLGKGGGTLAGGADLEFVIASDRCERIQELHMTILHVAIDAAERDLFPELNG